MLYYSTSCRYFMYREFCNMHFSFDRLGGIVNTKMDGGLMSGDIFIFINRRKNQCKLLRWSDGGFEIYHKRLAKGTFEIPQNGEIEAYELQLMLSGVVAEKIRKKTRFILKKNVSN